jgi:hypothetical protein
MVWGDFEDQYLTPAQQLNAQKFEIIGKEAMLHRIGQGPPPDITQVTLSQAKAARTKFEDMLRLVNDGMAGAQYVFRTLHEENAKNYDAANP